MNKYIHYKWALPLVLFVALLALVSCSKDRENEDLGPHPADWMTLSSDDFHGWLALADSAASCRGCHGANLTGGTAISCNECHAGGVQHLRVTNANPATHQSLVASYGWKLEGCQACHGADFTGFKAAARDSGAVCTRCHVPESRMDLNGCNVCHTTEPESFADWKVPYGTQSAGAHPGHVFRAEKHCSECHPSIRTSGHPHPLPADVSFERAHIADTLGFTPTFEHLGPANSGNGRCSNVYCHSDGKRPNPGPPVIMPEWTATQNITCGSCHRFPPAEPHPQVITCSQCHSNVDPTSNFNAPFPDSIRFVVDSLHVDGIVEF